MPLQPVTTDRIGQAGCFPKHPRPRRLIVASAAGVILVAFSSAMHPVPRLIWNATASAPVGLYWLVPGHTIRRGDLVLAQPPDSARTLAAARGYLPPGVPLVKRVVALVGDRICSVGATILINGLAAATRLAADSRGRPLPTWEGCRALGPDEVFLLMADVSGSFDGRYFGPVGRSAIAGRLVPLWTR